MKDDSGWKCLILFFVEFFEILTSHTYTKSKNYYLNTVKISQGKVHRDYSIKPMQINIKKYKSEK